MKLKLSPLLCCLIVLSSLALLSCGDVVAQRKALQGDKQSAQAAAPRRIKATNVVELRKHVGKQVAAYGPIGSTGKSSSGHNFLNFANSELSAVCLREHVAKFEAGAPADSYKGQTVVVTGKVELYQGKLQIKLTSPAQVKLEVETAPPPIKSVALRKIGDESWLSPAGLRYQGHDPQGLNRIEHIMRHARDMPKRDGPNGVFDADDQGEVFALIDEAWQRAQQKKLRPQLDGDRSSYLVPLDRRVGYLGGRTGALRGHPALSRVFIVFQTDTKNIVTAFPK